MTHTNEELKELAEFGAEFLGWKPENNSRGERKSWRLPSAITGTGLSCVDGLIGIHERVFVDILLGPIGMHLAQEKLEKEGFEWSISAAICKKYRCYIMSHKGKRADEIHESKFIAFWEAVRQAIGGEK